MMRRHRPNKKWLDEYEGEKRKRRLTKLILTLLIIGVIIIFVFLLIDPIFDLYKQIIEALQEAIRNP